MSASLSLRRDTTALLVVDLQERLFAVMPPEARARCERNVLLLVELARRLDLPVVVSEQYPKGLGPTLPSLEDALAAPGLRTLRFDKLEFGCTDCPAFAQHRAALGGRTQWIVVGMETHVCVFQTVRGLVELGETVYVPADAVLSRAPENREVGLRLAERAGAIVTCTETVIFDLLGRAGTDEFRAMSKLLK